MKVTKYGHACFTVEKNGNILVIDPGNMSPDFTTPSNVVGVVVTHAHGDHLDEKVISDIIEANPIAVIVGDKAVTSKLKDLPTKTAVAGDTLSIGGFELEFFGGDHAVIHESMSSGTNLGVMIDDRIYYPGDSFSLPDKPVDTLALPVSGPWLKAGEVIDFLLAVKPVKAFPTHDALNADRATNMYADVFKRFGDQIQTEFIKLNSGESLEV